MPSEPVHLRLPERMREAVRELAARLERLDAAPWPVSRLLLSAIRRGLPSIQSDVERREAQQ